MASERTDPEGDQPGPGGTPEGHTPEKPALDEYGKLGTPAAGLSPEVPHAADAEEAGDGTESTEVHAVEPPHIDGSHVQAHDVAHADDAESEHADEAEPLGPIDWRAWGAAGLGIAVAALVGLALALPNLPR